MGRDRGLLSFEFATVCVITTGIAFLLFACCNLAAMETFRDPKSPSEKAGLRKRKLGDQGIWASSLSAPLRR